MADDSLSQSEIDALLSGFGPTERKPEPGRPDFTSVRGYDFRHPSKLSKDQMRTLQMVYESFARRAASALSSSMRSVISMTLVSIEQSVFDDYVRGLPATTVMNMVATPPLPGMMIMEFGMELAYMFLDRLLGGKGRPFRREGTVTDIEEELLKTVTATFLSSLAQSWADVTAIEPALDSVDYSPRFVQIVGRNEVVILVVFDVRLFDFQATMSMCIPYPMIEPIVPKLTAQLLFAGSSRPASTQDQDQMSSKLSGVRIPVSVELGQTCLMLEDVVQLQIGDIIRLDNRVGEPLPVIVNGRPKFDAQPGIMGRKMGVRIENMNANNEEID